MAPFALTISLVFTVMFIGVCITCTWYRYYRTSGPIHDSECPSRSLNDRRGEIDTTTLGIARDSSRLFSETWHETDAYNYRRFQSIPTTSWPSKLGHLHKKRSEQGFDTKQSIEPFEVGPPSVAQPSGTHCFRARCVLDDTFEVQKLYASNHQTARHHGRFPVAKASLVDVPRLPNERRRLASLEPGDRAAAIWKSINNRSFSSLESIKEDMRDSRSLKRKASVQSLGEVDPDNEV